jgi:hypothetical protein
MAQRTLIGLLACLGAAATTASYARAADVRTGHWTNPHPQSLDATNPEPLAYSVRFDNTAGVLQAVVRLDQAVPDPTTTSRYRRSTVELRLGTTFEAFGAGGGCDGATHHRLSLTATLGTDDAPTVATDPLILADLGTPLQYVQGAAKSFNTARDELTITVAAPQLVNARFICWGGAAQDTANDTLTFITDRLLDGFTGSDGDERPAVVTHLADQIMYTNNLLGPRAKGAHDLGWLIEPACRKSGFAYRCSASAILRSIVGQPRLSLVGTSEPYDGKDRAGNIGTLVRPSYLGGLRWKRCPHVVDPRRAGRSCTIRIAWHTGDLNAYLAHHSRLHERL